MKKTLLLLIAILLATTTFAQQRVTITPGEGEAWWGYFTDNDANAANFSGYGVNAVADYETAIKIVKNDPIMGNATVKAMRLWLNSTTIPKITSLKIWVTKTLKINAQGVLYVQDVDLSTLTAGANDIMLNTPFAINNVVTYFGFTMTLNGQDYAIMNGGEYEANTFFFRATAQTTNWTSVTNHGKLALQLMGEGVNIPQNAAIITNKNLGTHNYQVGDEAVLPVTIKNKGENNITSVSYTITSNNDPSTATPEVTVPINNIVNGATATFDVLFDTSESVKNTRTVTITKVNGQPNDAPASDCVASGQFAVVSILFTKVPVVEEFTSTTCGWCPIGFDALENLSEEFGDKAVFIAVHKFFQNPADPMIIADYNSILVGSFPSSYVNRGGVNVYPEESNLRNVIVDDLNDTPDGMIDIAAQWNDEAMTSIKFDTSTKFAYKMNNANYGVALLLTDDGLSGTSSGWSQSNYLSHYNGYQSYTFWYNSPSTVTGVVYNHVAVAAWNILNGFDGSIPTSFEAGVPLGFNYIADISTKDLIQDKSKLKAIAFLIDRSTGHIINAGQTTIKPYGYNPAVPGDVDGDGEVTAGDVTALYNFLLNGDDSTVVNGDVDGDGTITAGDITAIYNILLGSKK